MQTHLSTLQAEVRKVCNSCDLGGFNAEFFLKESFVNNIASLIQQKEAAAYQRGMTAANGAQARIDTAAAK